MKKSANLIFTLIAAGVVLLAIHLRKNELPNKDDAKLKELQTLSMETPVFEHFTQVDTDYTSRAADATVYIYYKSSTPFEEVRAFYDSVLLQRGWNESSLHPSSRWLDDTGGMELRFSKGDLQIVIEYAGNRYDSSWSYSVAFLWRLK